MRISIMAIVVGAPACAQEWPTRPITFVVPFAAGGPVDVVVRIQAQRVGEILGQTVIVENVGGAAGMTGGARVAKAPPDGYMAVVGNVGTHAYSQTLYKKPLYNAATEFTPVGLVTESARVLVVRKDLPVNDLPEFVAYLKANHARMQFGSAGVGSATHVPCVLLNLAAGVAVTHVPYRGAGPVMQDLVAGQIDYMCDSIQTAAVQIKDKTVKGIAILAPSRSPILPDLATSGEQGLPGIEASAWNGYFVPKGTPEAIVRRFNAALGAALDSPAVRERLDGLGLTVVAPERRSPDYLGKFLQEEIERWAKPIQAAGIAVE
jgi:tripartite-type tricarboxylate transporter receptor subunit TctC